MDADVPVWTQTAVHLNDGSDRTALINEPGLGSSVALSEAKPQKKTFTRAILKNVSAEERLKREDFRLPSFRILRRTRRAL